MTVCVTWRRAFVNLCGLRRLAISATKRRVLMQDIVILDGARTAIGTFGGSLAGTAPIDTGTAAAKAAMERSGVEGLSLIHISEPTRPY